MALRILDDFISLLYPVTCSSCGLSLVKGESCICTKCSYTLPRTYYHLWPDNPMEKIFWGKTNIERAAAFCNFSKGGQVQRLVHNLKYRNDQEVGIKLGMLYGLDLRKSDWIQAIDYLVPVPLHKAKQRKRGFNQSLLIAEGIAKTTDIQVLHDGLYRTGHTDSQTRKGKFVRWKNVESIFELRNADRMINKHILLVDDVITTGSTLEACASTLQKIPGVKISVITLGCA